TPQRLWRTGTRRKYQLTRNRVQLHNRLESLLEEAHIKVSSLVSDLLGSSARRMLRAVANGETDPARVDALGSPRLHATAEQLCDALGASTDLHPLYRRLLAMTLAELEVIEAHMQQLDEDLAGLLHRRFVVRLGHAQAIGAIAHRICRLVWKILHDGVTYEERGPAVTKARAQLRAAKMIRELRSLGYFVELSPEPSGNAL